MISVAIQKGNSVYVYNERNSVIRTAIGTLYGYTANTYSVVRGNVVYTYSEKGTVISSRHV